MKMIFLLSFSLLVVVAACKKSNSGPDAASLYGTWQYTHSIVDSLFGQHNGPKQVFDPNWALDVADTLRFKAPDTVYYTSLGSTTWSNFRVSGHLLSLIGSTTTDSLGIDGVTATQLEIGYSNTAVNYTAVYQKVGP
jgi:hypothetical protein